MRTEGIVLLRLLTFVVTWMLWGCVTLVTAQAQSKCEEIKPKSLVESEKKFKVSALSIGKFALGEFSIEKNPKFIEFLNENVNNLIAVNYLVCIAKDQGLLEDKQVKDLYYTLLFLRTNPTSQEFIERERERENRPAIESIEKDKKAFVRDIRLFGDYQPAFKSPSLQTASAIENSEIDFNNPIRIMVKMIESVLDAHKTVISLMHTWDIWKQSGPMYSSYLWANADAVGRQVRVHRIFIFSKDDFKDPKKRNSAKEILREQNDVGVKVHYGFQEQLKRQEVPEYLNLVNAYDKYGIKQRELNTVITDQQVLGFGTEYGPYRIGQGEYHGVLGAKVIYNPQLMVELDPTPLLKVKPWIKDYSTDEQFVKDLDEFLRNS